MPHTVYMENMNPMPPADAIANFAMEITFMSNEELAHEVRALVGATAVAMTEGVATDTLTDRIKMVAMLSTLVGMEASNRLNPNGKQINVVDFIADWQAGA